MTRRTLSVLALPMVMAAASDSQPEAQAPRSLVFRVRETLGIRRTEYPVNARFSLPRAAAKEAARFRVVQNGAEVVAQFTTTSRWDDGSVQAIDVDFNSSMDPEEERRYELQFG